MSGKAHVRWCAIVLWSGFAVYILLLAAFLFGKASGVRSVNLIPFRTLMDDVCHRRPFALGNLLGNFLLLLPMGVYLALWKRSSGIREPVMWLLMIGVAVETAQYILRVGAADIDDLILNTLGGLAGIGMVKLLNRLDRDRLEQRIAVMTLIAGVFFLLLLASAETGLLGFRIHVFHEKIS